MRRTRNALVGAVAVALAVTGCTGGGDTPAPGDSGAPTASATASAAPVAPVVVGTVIEGQAVDLEVGPLAVHDDVAVLRLAAPVGYSALMSEYWHVFGGAADIGPNGARLVDLEAGTVMPVLRTADRGVSLATRNGSPGGPATDAAEAAAGEDVTVLYAAFPVVDASTVDVLLPSAGWVPDVPVVAAADAGVLTVPPAELVDEPVAEPVRYPLEAYTEQLGGQVRTRETTEQVAVAVSSDVLFAFDSDQLAPEADTALRAAAEQVAAHEGGTLTVVGHTDDQGEPAYNLDLSQRRAATVRDRIGALVDLSAFDVSVEGRGEDEPAVAGTGEAERALNRRVELVLVPTGDAPTDDARATDAPTTGALPDPQGPVAPGATGVSVVDGDSTFDVRIEQVHRVGGYVVGGLEVTNTGTEDLALGSLAVGAWDARGSFDAQLQFAPTNVTLVSGSTRLYPVDYLVDPEHDEREPLSDRVLDGIGPGTTQLVTVVWPDPGTSAVTVDVAPRHHASIESVQIAGRAPFRLTDVPVVDG